MLPMPVVLSIAIQKNQFQFVLQSHFLEPFEIPHIGKNHATRTILQRVRKRLIAELHVQRDNHSTRLDDRKTGDKPFGSVVRE
jgi:hypothetical protein